MEIRDPNGAWTKDPNLFFFGSLGPKVLRGFRVKGSKGLGVRV